MLWPSTSYNVPLYSLFADSFSTSLLFFLLFLLDLSLLQMEMREVFYGWWRREVSKKYSNTYRSFSNWSISIWLFGQQQKCEEIKSWAYFEHCNGEIVEFDNEVIPLQLICQSRSQTQLHPSKIHPWSSSPLLPFYPPFLNSTYGIISRLDSPLSSPYHHFFPIPPLADPYWPLILHGGSNTANYCQFVFYLMNDRGYPWYHQLPSELALPYHSAAVQ